MLHHGHPSTAKMNQSAEAFWWPGLHREFREKSENCPSCRASGKNLKTQLPSTEKKNLDILSEPNQETQLDFAGPIKSKTRGNVYILVAVDRFSKWPAAQICKNTDTQTVLKFSTSFFPTTELRVASAPTTEVVLKVPNLKNFVIERR